MTDELKMASDQTTRISTFFTGHSTMAEINQLCQNGMGSPRSAAKNQFAVKSAVKTA